MQTMDKKIDVPIINGCEICSGRRNKINEKNLLITEIENVILLSMYNWFLDYGRILKILNKN